FFAMVHPSDRKQLAEAIQSHVQGSSDKYKHYFRMLTAEGTWKWVYAEGQITFRSAEEAPLFMHGIHQDIQTSRTQEQRLRESEARFKAYTENAPVGIFIVKDYRFTYVNPGAVRITGYSEDELHDMRITDLIHPDEYRQVMHGVYNILRKGIIENEYVLRVVTKEKDIRWLEIRVSRLNLRDASYLLSVVDITARKNAEVRLKEYATFDELTGVYNRRVGLTMLQHELHTARREQQPLSVCFVDVNGLKKVNDTFGHDEGDQLIQKVAETMRQQLRRGDLLCRLGGDEFLMVYRNCSCENASKIWERIEAELRQTNHSSEKPYEISVSRGILEYDESVHSDVHELLNQADKIMYIHKDQYRARMREKLKGTDPRLVSDGQ
ncbi:MAG: sensor domain-containing diguanylate cyclase, partial [Spirochaetota bacterium]